MFRLRSNPGGGLQRHSTLHFSFQKEEWSEPTVLQMRGISSSPLGITATQKSRGLFWINFKGSFSRAPKTTAHLMWSHGGETTPLINTIWGNSMLSTQFPTITWTLRSSLSLVFPRLRAMSLLWTLFYSRTDGPCRRTPSDLPTSTETSCPSSWETSGEATTPKEPALLKDAPVFIISSPPMVLIERPLIRDQETTKINLRK